MTDIFLKDFYNKVSDRSWPTIKNYSDFLKLPLHIQNECLNIHGLPQRLEQIESSEYWSNSLAKVYQYKNLAYLPVLKCASTYYINLFCNQLDWKECNFLDLEPGTVCFGLFDDPTTRYLKGITEWVWNQVLPMVDYDISRVSSSVLKTIVVGDTHSLPYTTTFGTVLSKINCIPMDGKSDQQIKQILTNLFKSQKHNITLPINDNKIHQSSDLKLKLYQLVKENFEHSVAGDPAEFFGRAEYTYILLASDLKFYRNLLQSFDPHWQHIKTI